MAVNAVQKEKRSAARGGFSFYHRLALLYVLNLTDWLCTRVLLASGFFVRLWDIGTRQMRAAARDDSPLRVAVQACGRGEK